MEFGLLIAQLILAAVFGMAGIAKLRDRAGSRKAVADFGLPDRIAGPISTLLPAVELSVALALIPARTAGWAALSGLALLVAFSAAISINLLQGRTPDCHCFGQLHSSPVGWSSLARNATLAGAAASVGFGTLLWLAAGLAVAGLLLGLRSKIGASRETAHAEENGLPIGAPAPSFALPDLTGTRVTLDSLREAGTPVLLVFTDPGCGPCIAMAPALAGWQRRHRKELTIVAVSRGETERNEAEAEEHELTQVLVQTDSEVADLYAAQGTPTAVLVGVDGRIASQLAAGQSAIETLLAEHVTGFEFPSSLAEATQISEPRPGLVRRELLLRLVGAMGTAMALLASPGTAAEVLSTRGRPCRQGRKRCGTRCCPPTFVCLKRRGHRPRCACPPGLSVCGGRCVRLRTNAQNCGRCGDDCPPGTVCLYGNCQGGDGSGTGPGGTGPCDCPPGHACCSGRCTDFNADAANCGGCGKRCPQGNVCCEGKCLDPQSDPKNCGGCGRHCSSGEVCGRGRCRGSCPPDLTRCGKSCVDLHGNDDANCGRCGRTCAFLTSAHSPKCCGGSCVDLATNPSNCGDCGVVCPPHCACGTNSAGVDGCFFCSG